MTTETVKFLQEHNAQTKEGQLRSVPLVTRNVLYQTRMLMSKSTLAVAYHLTTKLCQKPTTRNLAYPVHQWMKMRTTLRTKYAVNYTRCLLNVSPNTNLITSGRTMTTTQIN